MKAKEDFASHAVKEIETMKAEQEERAKSLPF
jgi:hypothetical protein